MDESDEHYQRQKAAVRMAASKKTGIGGLVLLAIIIFAIWFLFIRVDYKDVWFKESTTARVIYCGSYSSPQCSTGETYYLPVKIVERAKAAYTGDPLFTFEIHFKNGGYVEVEGTCDKAPEGMYPFDRFCRTETTDGSDKMYIIAPTE